MIATGIVRRLDDLGRVVIPVEIRRRLSLREGSPLELYLDGNSIVFKPYNPLEIEMSKISSVLNHYLNSYAIYDHRKIRSYNPAHPYTPDEEKRFPVKLDDVDTVNMLQYPVVHEGEVLYTIVSDKNITDAQELAVKAIIESLLSVFLD